MFKPLPFNMILTVGILLNMTLPKNLGDCSNNNNNILFIDAWETNLRPPTKPST